jgi:glycosyltransferase involved in cell wall biosynthesis
MRDDGDVTVLIMEPNGRNPYTELLTDALRDINVESVFPEPSNVFRHTRAVLSHPDADIVQIDWAYGNYMSADVTGSKRADTLITVARSIGFVVDLLLVSLLGRAIVWTVHNTSHHDGFFPRCERIVNEFLFCIADAVTVKCSAAAHIVADEYTLPSAGDFEIVRDGNYIPVYENSISQTAARERLGIDDETFVFLFFGGIRRYKRVPRLIEAFRELPLGDAELWIAGRPNDHEIERSIAEEGSITTGVHTRLEYIPTEDVQVYMNAADVLALPYDGILNSGTVHLGMSFGLPILAPAVGCIPKTVADANDLLYNGENLNAALRDTCDRSDLREVGNANHQRACDRDWHGPATDLAAIYRSVS